MKLDTLTKEQANTIVGWARTEAGELFQSYLNEQMAPLFQDLQQASNMRDVFRAQGANALLERVMQFFSFATAVAEGHIKTESMEEEWRNPLPAPWGEME